MSTIFVIPLVLIMTLLSTVQLSALVIRDAPPGVHDKKDNWLLAHYHHHNERLENGIRSESITSQQYGNTDDDDMIKDWSTLSSLDLRDSMKSTTTGLNGIQYHGGKVMMDSPKVHYIFYGDWTTDPIDAHASSILVDLGRSLQGAKIWSTLQTYYQLNKNGVPKYIQEEPHWGQVTTDPDYSQGTSLDDNSVWNIVAQQLLEGRLPIHDNHIYLVLTSKDVSESQFCKNYCGWHTSSQFRGTTIRYGFIGNAIRCPNACVPHTNMKTTANDNPMADAMANTIIHELVEAISDPDISSWYSDGYLENGDKCAWQFGQKYITPNGGEANVEIGQRHFLIQHSWVNANNGYCAGQFP